MKARQTILAVGAAVLVIVAGALAQGMHHHGGMMGDFGFGDGGPMLGFFSDYLDLTSAQQDQIKAIWAKEKPTVQPLLQQLKQAHVDLGKLETSGTFDEGKVRALASQQSQTITELIVQKARIKSEMVQVLTPDQKTKLAQLEAKHEARMQKHGQDMPAPPAEQQ